MIHLFGAVHEGETLPFVAQLPNAGMCRSVRCSSDAIASDREKDAACAQIVGARYAAGVIVHVTRSSSYHLSAFCTRRRQPYKLVR